MQPRREMDAKTVIPIHYSGWSRFRESSESLRQELRRERHWRPCSVAEARTAHKELASLRG